MGQPARQTWLYPLRYESSPPFAIPNHHPISSLSPASSPPLRSYKLFCGSLWASFSMELERNAQRSHPDVTIFVHGYIARLRPLVDPHNSNSNRPSHTSHRHFLKLHPTYLPSPCLLLTVRTSSHLLPHLMHRVPDASRFRTQRTASPLASRPPSTTRTSPRRPRSGPRNASRRWRREASSAPKRPTRTMSPSATRWALVLHRVPSFCGD